MKKAWKSIFAKNNKMPTEDAHPSIDIDQYLRYGINVLLNDYLSKVGGYIADNPIALGIRDASELPYPKESIIRLLIVALLFENDEKKYNAMEIVLTQSLPRFQEGIGPKKLNPGGGNIDITDLNRINNMEKDDSIKLLMEEFKSDLKLKEAYDINHEKVSKDISEMYEILNVIRKHRLL